MLTLLATDLARAEAHDQSWRRSRAGCRSPSPGRWITSTGYAFVEHAAPPETDDLRVVVGAPSEEDRRGSPPDGDTSFRGRLTLAVPQGGAIIVDVGRGGARVGIEPSQWAACAGPVLLAISVCWRFGEIDRTLDELSDWTRSQLRGEGRAVSGIRGGELDRRSRALHGLIVDLPCFEASLDDPGGYFPSGDATRLYRRLARRLGLVAWRTRLDERIEILEGVVGYLVDERRHRQQLRWAIGLEVLILLALLGDISLHLALTLLE